MWKASSYYSTSKRSQLSPSKRKRRTPIKNTPVNFITKSPERTPESQRTPSQFLQPFILLFWEHLSPFSSTYSKKETDVRFTVQIWKSMRIYSDQNPIRIVNKSDKTETDLLCHAITSRGLWWCRWEIGLWKDLIKTGRRLQQVVWNTIQIHWESASSCIAFMRFVFQ